MTWNTNIERHDPDLISIVEELGTEMGDAMNQDSMDGTEDMGVKE